MLWLSRFTSLIAKRTPAALALTVIAAAACGDRDATAPQLTAPQQRASADINPTPAMSVTPTVIGWGSVALGTATSGRVVKITSTGTAPLLIFSLTLGGTNPDDFLIDTDGCSGVWLNPGASCTAYVSFEPFALGWRSATLTITTHNAGGPVVVSLGGTGVKGGPYIP
jgi:hypothetical protein